MKYKYITLSKKISHKRICTIWIKYSKEGKPNHEFVAYERTRKSREWEI